MDKRVIVIGGGGAGLAALSALTEAGFETLLLEKSAHIGGIWHKTQYPNLHIHSKSFNYRFLSFRPIQSAGERASRAEVLRYFDEFVQSRGLDRYIKVNTEVTEIIYHKNKTDHSCEVRAVDTSTNEEIRLKAYRVVLALGFTNGGNPHRPQFQNQESFTGTVVHSSDFNQEMLDDILVNNRQVVMLGAGKSSHEILSLFRGHEQNVTWVYSKSLWALSYEKMYARNLSMIGFIILYAYYLLLSMVRRRRHRTSKLMYYLQRPLVWSGFFLNPLETSTDIFQNRLAIMQRDQFHFLKKIRSIKSSISELQSRSIILNSGEHLPADYLICATGHERGTNLPRIKIYEDGLFAGEYMAAQTHSFYLNMIDPKYPALALFSSGIIFSQQIFGFSIAALWLARFYAGTLVRPATPERMEQNIRRSAARHAAWIPDAKYLSKSPYSYDKDNFVLGSILNELGLDRALALKLLVYATQEEKFAELCTDIAHQLSVRRPPASRVVLLRRVQ